ncbi:hypothetical protein BJY01DRAFT_214425 [Aspergillus pseudoustus]|uniref:F-box domain-containing protein n=1 Tax=Aspergillus pseudoustus TaxID=1810923 RepID=A0ABR4JYS7_9EURO
MSREQLPTELWILISTDSDLETEDQMNLSLVCWKFRHICAPSILYSVTFPCTRKGLEGLQELSHSELRQYVERLRYYMPPFCKFPVEDPGAGEDHDELVEVKKIIQERSEENQYIVDSELDLTALSLALQSLPCLSDLIFSFRNFIPGEQDQVSRKLSGLHAKKETFEHHIPVLAQAVSQARTVGRHFSSIRLVGFQLPRLPESEVLGDDERAQVVLRDSVKELFAEVGCVRLSLGGSVFNLCEKTRLSLRELHILNLAVDYEVLKSFLRHNISTLRRIEYYNLQLRNQPEEEDRWLKPSFFSKILHSFHLNSRIWRRGRDELNWTFTRGDCGFE